MAFGKCWKSSRVVSEATAVTNRKVLGCDGCGWHVRGVVICSIEQGVCDFTGIGKECGELRVQPVIVQSACDGVGGSEECSELGVEPGIVGSVRVRR